MFGRIQYVIQRSILSTDNSGNSYSLLCILEGILSTN